MATKYYTAIGFFVLLGIQVMLGVEGHAVRSGFFFGALPMVLLLLFLGPFAFVLPSFVFILVHKSMVDPDLQQFPQRGTRLVIWIAGLMLVWIAGVTYYSTSIDLGELFIILALNALMIVSAIFFVRQSFLGAELAVLLYSMTIVMWLFSYAFPRPF